MNNDTVMVNPSEYATLTPEQSKVLANAIQLFEALEEARRDDPRFKGSMLWKNVRGHEYLYRVLPGGVFRSLGRRTPDNEARKQSFEARRAAHRERTRSLIDQVKLHASYIKANRLNRFPLAGARVVRALRRANLPHRVIGTTAMHVYEVAAGVLILPALLTTEDMDVMMDASQGIRLAAKLRKRTLLSLLKDTDKSFKRLTDSPFEFTAANDSGYRVDFVSQGSPSPVAGGDFSQLLQQKDLKPVGIDSLKWLVATPRFSGVVFDQKGAPLRVHTVDPRAFVLHKWYVAHRDDRAPVKRRRDEAQSRLVATILANELPHLADAPAIRRLFPKSVVRDSPLDDEFDV